VRDYFGDGSTRPLLSDGLVTRAQTIQLLLPLLGGLQIPRWNLASSLYK